MNRRIFLKSLFILSSAAVLSQCNLPEEDYGDTVNQRDNTKTNENPQNTIGNQMTETNSEIIVIGAGISGLSAARKLREQGYDVIVIEARSRIGGRVWTSREWADAPLDLGASWIHGVKGNPITSIVKDNNIKTVVTDYENHWIYNANGREISDADYDRIDGYTDLLEEYIAEAEKESDEDISIQSIVDRVFQEENLSAIEKREILYALNTVVEHEYAGDINALSAFYFDQGEDFQGEDVIFPLGYDQIVNVLAAGLDIRLNEKVQTVAYNQNGVVISTDQGKYSGKYTVITLPLGVLKSGSVQFSPALPAKKTNAIQQLGIGLLDKVYLRFPQIFWENGAELIGYIGERKGEWAEWLNIAHYTGKPILLGFNAATFARQTENWSDQKIVAEAMNALRTIFGPNIPEPSSWQITRWAADPYALGSYSYLAVGTNTKTLKALAAPVDERLFFAGEATSQNYQATVHGAYLSGIRAAEEIWDLD